MTWRARRVREMAQLSNGLPFPSTSFSPTESVPLVRIRDIAAHEFDTYIPRELVPPDALLRNGDIVVGMDGDYNVQLWDRGEAALNQRVCALRARPEFDGRFLAYSLPAHLEVINDLTYATTVKHLSSWQVEHIVIEAPELAEQRAIADFLDEQTSRIDTLINKQTQLITTLRERRSGTVRHAIDNVSTTSPLDKIGRRTTIGNGSTPRRETLTYWAGGDYPWLNSAVVNNDSVTGSEQYVTSTARAECHLPTVRAGAVLVGLTGQGRTRGMATLLEIEATVSQHVAYIQPDSSCWNSRFLLWTMRSKYEYLRRISDENGSTKGGLTCGDLSDLRVARPPLDEQREIVAYLDEQTATIDTLIAKTEQHIALAKERRSALITAAVTGQIDVRTAARAEKVSV